MKATKTIRYIGFSLMTLSLMLLLYLYSFSQFKETRAGSADQYTVLEISADTAKFPRTDFDVLFSNLELASSAVQINAASSVELQQNQISAAVDGMKSDHVIIFAWKDACIPALTASLTHPDIDSVILLSPEITGSDAMEMFGTHQPAVPVAIFDVDTKYSASFYERLSGEDAALFPALKDNGITAAAVYISPDSSRYLSQWDFLGQSNTARTVIAFLPQVQIKIGSYISSYVFDPASKPEADSRSAVAAAQSIKILAVTFMTAGLLMFFASIPKTVHNPDKDIQTEITTGTMDRARRRVFMLRALIAAVFSAVLFILYFLNVSFAPVILASWPLLYYAAGAVLMFQFTKKHFANTRVPVKRLAFSIFIGFLVITDIILLQIMYSVSVETTFFGLHGILRLLFTLLLFVFSWIRLSTDLEDLSIRQGEDRRTAKLRGWYQQVSITFPYAVNLVFLLVTGKRLLSLQCIFLVSVLLVGIWIRHIFRRTSGTQWLAAIMFSIFYSVIAFA